MLFSYIKTSWRNLLKHKGFSFINITGLAIGLSCFLLIALYVADELSYDRFNEKADRIYRINSDITMGGTNLKLTTCSDPMGATLLKDYPSVENFVRLYASGGTKFIKKGNAFIEEHRVVHADSTLFDVFTLPALYGNTHTALQEPNSVVITATAAKKYFGTTNVVGRFIETRGDQQPLYKINAVIKDMPKNAHFNVDFFFSMDNVEYDFGNFLSHNFQTYLLLKPGTDPRVFERNFPAVIQRYIFPQAIQFMQLSTMEEFKKSGNNLAYHLMPVKDIHLYSDRFPELGVNSDARYVYLFAAVAIFILVIACINFMNLSTARSAARAKEVGIRKVLGTDKKSLVAQFLTESVLLVMIALVIALLITWGSLSFFNEVAAKSLQMSTVFSLNTLPFLILLPLIVGILAGSYPAFFLSAFKPIIVLKGSAPTGFRQSKIRSSLVVFQFFVAVVLIVGVTIIYKQLNYIQSRQPGFDKEQLLIINGTGLLGSNAVVFKEAVAKLTGIKGASFSSYLPVSSSHRSDNTFSGKAVINEQNGFSMQTWKVDYDYLTTLGMEIIQGRNFSPDFGTDSSGVVINETAAKLLGLANPVGKKIYTFDNQIPDSLLAYTVIGVVKNFNFESMRQEIGPLCFQLGNNQSATAFKIATTDVAGLIKSIENKWKALAPGLPFNYQFLDEAFNNMYRAEQRVGKIALAFALLTIFIACLGLFGLATYMAEQRTREIGIRKVLGASVSSITGMLSGDFLKLVSIAFVLALPVAWLAMHQWLQEFAYRINIHWGVFAMAGVITLLIALCTVSFQAIKAALSNPVKSLRAE